MEKEKLDFCWGETSTFVKDIISSLHQTFKIGTVYNKAFRYLGLDIIESGNAILI